MVNRKKQILYNVLTAIVITIMMVGAVLITKKIKTAQSKADTASMTETVTENESTVLQEEITEQTDTIVVEISQQASIEDDLGSSVTSENSTQENTTTEKATSEEKTTEGIVENSETEIVTAETTIQDVTTQTTENVVAEESVMSCTVQINCNSVLDNIDKLAEGKESCVPSNGVILGTVSITFSEGETAFDVLKRACSSYGIQLEYSYTPVYGSYYIEGINNLYEFDCGSGSGWTFYVNGSSPNRGCSSYKMSDGDSMVWSYYCK